MVRRMYRVESRSDGLVFREGDRLLRVRFMTDSIARITYTQGREFLHRSSRIVVARPAEAAFDLREESTRYVLTAASLTVTVNKLTGALAYFDAADRMLMSEPEGGGRSLTLKAVTRNVFRKDAVVAAEQSIDGARATVAEHQTVFDRDAFEAKLDFVFAEDEAL